ncbi:hypothetical protein QE374_000715 [Microbacterium sp. SORGH_AS428]|uniref:heparan-alpha-glucosaminide N-acetyltransferase domain-containing protein n=1 Tax=Microbacterium sp. SORGH_AS_0428 TaxID=3041788 RepID=UPI002865A0F4|nr:heparan-alpha-glucosaminide N-acetyltransferase domain-containing protein [Microbacterium sp. SORGH_AS_0428]MDR6198806.1 hypothetical protein [Microbacterium sp. SORGH_AS_0428]
MRRALARLTGPDRLGGIDLARGLAVIGMLAAHLLTIEEPFDLTRPQTWADIVNGRSSILFAVLAGVSIALTTGGTSPVSGERLRVARGRLLVRAGLIWVLGILLILTGVPVYVILPAYAVLFLLALPLLRLGAGALFVVAAVLLAVMPFVQAALGLLPFWDTAAGESVALVVGWAYPFPLWIGFLVLGLALGRMDLRDVRIAAILVVMGIGTALFAYGAGGLAAPVTVASDYWGVALSTYPHSGGLPEVVGGAATAVAVLGGCLLIARTPVTWVLLPLRATGSMPLTAYTAQLLIWAVWALFALGETGALWEFRELAPFWPVTIAVVTGCTVWALTIGRGPLERLFAWVARRSVRTAAERAR